MNYLLVVARLIRSLAVNASDPEDRRPLNRHEEDPELHRIASAISALGETYKAADQQRNRDVREAREADRRRLRIEQITMWTLILGTIGAIGTLVYSAKTASEAGKAAAAAQTSADVARQQLEATTRPWLSIDLISTGPITFDASGARVRFTLKALNVGHSPATNVNLFASVVNENPPNVLKLQEDCAAFWKSSPPKSWPGGRTIFPDRDFVQPYELVVDKSQLSKSFVGFNAGTLLLHVIGCVDYAVSPDARGDTFFSYDIFGTDSNGRATEIVAGTDVPAGRVKAYEGSINRSAR